MDSLYGGHQGNSFVLRSAFQSYADMVTAFKQGPAYTGVWYNEYCILDTPNKNDKDNGKIYQRGLNYQDAKLVVLFILDKSLVLAVAHPIWLLIPLML